MSGAGKLKIVILEARLTHDTEPLGKMDPYVIVETRMQRFRTKTQDDAGKTPAWADEVLEIDVKYVGDDIHFVVMDEEVASDDHVGECTVKLTSFIGAKDSKTAEMDDWWEIFYEGKSAGHIHMKAIWTPIGEPLKELPPPQELAQAPPPALVMSSG
jgi:Ca2+-dependent lipid-binding protein